jgi:pimeloyl-ACP methyl ester carboxylesterase
VLLFSILFFLAVILVPLGIYAVYCVRFYRIQPRIIYHPHDNLDIKSKDRTIDHEEIFYRTADGVMISAWYIPCVSHAAEKGVEKNRGTVLFCHGNAGNISRRIDSFKIFRRLGLSTFIFDYRGYGKSEGIPTEKGTYRDADGAWNYLVKEMKVKPEEIIVFGRSLGGGIASYLAREYHPRALIIESSFTSIRDMGAVRFRWLPLKFPLRFKYNTRARLKHIRCPVLIVHSPDDRLIPFSHGQALYEAATPPKKFLRIDGDHLYGFIRSKRIYIKGLKDFIDGLPGPAKSWESNETNQNSVPDNSGN